MKAAGNDTASAGLGLNLGQLVVTSQGEWRHGDWMLGCFRDTGPAARRLRQAATLRRAGP